MHIPFFGMYVIRTTYIRSISPEARLFSAHHHAQGCSQGTQQIMLLHLQWSRCVANFPRAAIDETHWQLMRCMVLFVEITCRLVHSGMDRGLVGRRRIRGNPALPSEMYVPSNLQLMRQELWLDRHLCQHRRNSHVPRRITRH